MKSQWLFGKNKNYAVAWEIENPKAIVQIFHGIVEHSHRYEPLALRLNQLGFSVYSHDQVGHGRTAGTEAKFGVMDGNWRNYVEDAHLLTQQIRKRNPDVPIFLLGQSMGSFVVRAYLAKYGKNIAGAILTGGANLPCYESYPGIVLAKGIRLFMGPNYRSKLLEFCAMNKYNLLFPEKKSKAIWLTTDHEEVKIRDKDIFCNFTPTANMYVALVELVVHIKKHSTLVSIPSELPILMCSGSEDALSSRCKHILKLDKRLRKLGKNVKTKIYPGSRHEIFRDQSREKATKDIARWMENILDKQWN